MIKNAQDAYAPPVQGLGRDCFKPIIEKKENKKVHVFCTTFQGHSGAWYDATTYEEFPNREEALAWINKKTVSSHNPEFRIIEGEMLNLEPIERPVEYVFG